MVCSSVLIIVHVGYSLYDCSCWLLKAIKRVYYRGHCHSPPDSNAVCHHPKCAWNGHTSRMDTCIYIACVCIGSGGVMVWGSTLDSATDDHVGTLWALHMKPLFMVLDAHVVLYYMYEVP